MSEAPADQDLFSQVPRGPIDVAAYMPLADHLARDLSMRLPQHINRDELASAGYEALIKAANNYDPDKGVPFNAYAAQRIRGALLDELRSMDWASRGARDRISVVDACRDQMTADLGRVPEAKEIAERIGFSMDDMHKTQHDSYRAKVNSLEYMQETLSFDAVAIGLGPEEETVHSEQIRYLYAALSLLPERTREILEEYYFENMSMAEIAQKHGIAGQRVQQIISEAFPKMREAITQTCSPGEGVAARRRAEFAADVQELAQKAQIIDIAPRLASRSA